MPLALRFEVDRGTAVLDVAGDLDVSSAPQLREACVALVRIGHHDLILDLDSVALIDSYCIGVLVGVLKKVRALGGDLRLVCNQGHLRRVFTLTGLDRLCTVSSSRDALLGLGTGVPTVIEGC